MKSKKEQMADYAAAALAALVSKSPFYDEQGTEGHKKTAEELNQIRSDMAKSAWNYAQWMVFHQQEAEGWLAQNELPTEIPDPPEPFKEGDLVTCMFYGRNNSEVYAHMDYTVEKVEDNVIRLVGVTDWWAAGRFKLKQAAQSAGCSAILNIPGTDASDPQGCNLKAGHDGPHYYNGPLGTFSWSHDGDTFKVG